MLKQIAKGSTARFANPRLLFYSYFAFETACKMFDPAVLFA